jgi:hypothetical protein
MEIVGIERNVKNSNILLIGLGILIFPYISAVSELIISISTQLFDLTMYSMIYMEIGFELVILIGLAVVILVVKRMIQNEQKPLIMLSQKTMKFIFISFLFIWLVKMSLSTIYLSQLEDRSRLLLDSGLYDEYKFSYLNGIKYILSSLRNLLVVGLFFVILFRQNATS